MTPLDGSNFPNRVVIDIKTSKIFNESYCTNVVSNATIFGYSNSLFPSIIPGTLYSIGDGFMQFLAKLLNESYEYTGTKHKYNININNYIFNKLTFNNSGSIYTINHDRDFVALDKLTDGFTNWKTLISRYSAVEIKAKVPNKYKNYFLPYTGIVFDPDFILDVETGIIGHFGAESTKINVPQIYPVTNTDKGVTTRLRNYIKGNDILQQEFDYEYIHKWKNKEIANVVMKLLG